MTEWLLVVIALSTHAEIAHQHPRGSAGYVSEEACSFFGQEITRKTPGTTYECRLVKGD